MFGLISDIHITDLRISDIDAAIDRCAGILKEKGIGTLFILGDIFDSRKSLTFDSLHCFHRILEKLSVFQVIMIPGNHDKIDYQSKESYLDVFKYHPNASLYDDTATIFLDGYSIYLLPFFDENTALLERLGRLSDIPEKSILLTHIAIDGVRNNDGSLVSGKVNKSVFDSFEKVIIGHYHNEQEFGNVLYMGSFIPKDFSENDRKGLTVFDNGKITQCPLTDKKYLTVDIDLNSEDGKEKLKQYQNSTDNIRFQFYGDKAQLGLIEKSQFETNGIKVSFKERGLDIENISGTVDFSGFNKAKIVTEWDGFCTGKRGKYKEQGKILLQKI